MCVLAFDLVTPEQRQATVARLVALIEQADDHLGAGFLSTPMLPPVRHEHGRQDIAFRLLFQTTSPSWLYQVERGATTIWETWEGYTDKGEATQSHNHYAFGSVAGWLVEGIAGEQGFRPRRSAVGGRPPAGPYSQAKWRAPRAQRHAEPSSERLARARGARWVRQDLHLSRVRSQCTMDDHGIGWMGQTQNSGCHPTRSSLLSPSREAGITRSSALSPDSANRSAA